MLRKNFFSADEIIAIVKDFRHANLPPDEVAVMTFARKMTLHAHEVGPDDYKELRGFGLSEEEILDILLASAIRGFISKTMDGLGTTPDAASWEFEPALLTALALGRPIP